MTLIGLLFIVFYFIIFIYTIDKISRGKIEYIIIYICTCLPIYTTLQAQVFKIFDSEVIVTIIKLSKDIIFIYAFMIFIFGTNIHLNERVQEISDEKGMWTVKTSLNKTFSTPNIIIAGGVGSFEPRKLPLKELEKFEKKSVFYSVIDKNLFKNKKITIFGGGDSALDWALEFSKTSKVTLVHRREEFRGAPHTLAKLEKLKKEGKILIKTPFQIKSVNEGEKLKAFVKEPKYRTGFDRNFWIWEEYQEGFTYMVSADVARGDGKDYSTFHIFKIETMEVVGNTKAS